MIEIRGQSIMSFAELEHVLWESLKNTFLEAVQTALEALDRALMEQRDTSRYLYHDLRPRQVGTRIGVIQIKRRYYWDLEEKRWVALLDEALGLEAYQRVGTALRQEAVVAAVSGRSYRGAQAELERHGELVVSHEAIRRWTLRTGEALARQAEAEIRAPAGKRRPPVLIVETDGFWLSVQGAGKREERIVVSHEGWRPRTPGSRDLALVHRRDCIGLGPAEFWDRVSACLETKYDLSETWVVINGDRAKWIRQGVEWFPRALYQFDRFHLLRDLRRALRGDEEALRAAQKAVEDNDPQRLLEVLATAEKTGKLKAEQRRLLRGLDQDIAAMPEAVKDYRVRLRELGVAVEDYHGIGAAEGAVARYSARLRRGRSWSESGLGVMLRALAASFAGTLGAAVQTVERWAGLEPEVSQVRERAKHRALEAVAAKLDGVKHGHFPALEAGRTRSGGLARFFRQVIDGVDPIAIT